METDTVSETLFPNFLEYWVVDKFESSVILWEEKQFVDVYGEQRTEEGGKEVMCISYELVIGDKKSKASSIKPRKE
jgi:hypothetical protein